MTKPTAHIPSGVADYFWGEAYRRRQLESTLLATFRGWGYGDVIPPTFEYDATLGIEANADLQAEMYRFLDRDGGTLALRPEMTTAVARLVGTRLHDWPMPQRFCYAGSVFRYTEPQAGRQREFWQAGVELIGANSPQADAEVLALTIAALDAAGLDDFRIVLGHMGYLRGLLDDLKLPPAQADALRQAIDRKSEPELADFLRDVPLTAPQRRTVEELPLLNGPDGETVIAQAAALCLNPAMSAALDNLRTIYAALTAQGMAHRVDLDLAEIRNLGYYTGITFEALVPHLGFSVASGGRYDALVGHFGPNQLAVGVALGIDRLVLALESQSGATASLVRPVPPDILVSVSDDPDCLAALSAWRAEGKRVMVDVMGRTGAELAAYGAKIGAVEVLIWSNSDFQGGNGNDNK